MQRNDAEPPSVPSPICNHHRSNSQPQPIINTATAPATAKQTAPMRPAQCTAAAFAQPFRRRRISIDICKSNVCSPMKAGVSWSSPMKAGVNWSSESFPTSCSGLHHRSQLGESTLEKMLDEKNDLYIATVLV